MKHVEVINGDEGFYPEPMKDYGNLYEYCRIGLQDKAKRFRGENIVIKVSSSFQITHGPAH